MANIEKNRKLMVETIRRFKSELNEASKSPADEAEALAKKGKVIKNQITDLQSQMNDLQKQYNDIVDSAGEETLNKIEIALKKKYPSAKIYNNKNKIKVLLKKPDHIDMSGGMSAMKREITKMAGLPDSAFKSSDTTYATSDTISSFELVLNAGYKKAHLNFPDWLTAVAKAK